MRILLYEPQHTGHHYAYLARMLPGFLELPVEVVLATTPAGLASPEYDVTLAPFADRMRIEPICTPPPRGSVRNAWHRLRELRAAIRQVQPDHVYVLYADGLWPIATVLGMIGVRILPRDVAVEAWIYRGGLAYPDATGLGAAVKRRLFRRCIRQGLFDVLHLDDELLMEFATRRRGPGDSTRLVLTPNPVAIKPPMDKAEARRALGLPTDGRIISSSGMIAAWKGMDRLIQAFVNHLARRRELEDVRLVLAGPHAPEIRRMLGEPAAASLASAGRIVSMDRYVTEDEMFACAASSDVVAAVYPNHAGRSSIILWAAAAGRPVVAAARGCIGHVTTQQRLGATCDAMDVADIAAGLTQMIAQPWTAADEQRVRTYAESHSFERYRESATLSLRSRLERDVTDAAALEMPRA